ncbi:MAG: flagellar basal body-associated FliL family protein [Massilia sp.]|uniref:flagellar basal body-associated FliL family protein n=1 Tax=Massilia sp. TaxID=1882437 RepID=UPI0019876E89|nr:flagellar basal body-associated FliL family protein [Oxalobacteraceae sp. CFBP 8761]MBD8628372.1 flagellar basal body-associated FliL family protein [Oxalobacteraceae sp. CFBP 8753]MBD8632831.1 flagellar basal body-associated FliL family protein [Oxalobacteraceae sp. CFBP 8755]MBD8722230.1 flagellar basal body-associated FliL family protein [Oxalobacteraceae sp. CFBP 13708]
MKSKLIIAIAAVAVLAAAAAGGAMWYTSTTAGAAVAAKPAPETKLTKYVTLDKVIVMLRRAPAEQATHYLSVDLVLATTAADEKATKEQLPLLRSIVVSALSARTMTEASAMTVDQYAAELNKVFNANYAKENHIKPFSEVMVGKLIIE